MAGEYKKTVDDKHKGYDNQIKLLLEQCQALEKTSNKLNQRVRTINEYKEKSDDHHDRRTQITIEKALTDYTDEVKRKFGKVHDKIDALMEPAN